MARQVEHGREGVLLLRDPGHRFHVDRMQGEDGRRQIRPGHRQPAQDQRHQHGRGGVQQDVHQVIAERGVAPEPVLDPERAVQQRIVLLRGPESNQMRYSPCHDRSSGRVTWASSSQMKPALPGRLVGQKDREHQSQRPDPIPPVERLNCNADRLLSSESLPSGFRC